MTDDTDRYICEAGHDCGTDPPDGLTCRCGAAVRFALSTGEISHQVSYLLECWDDYIDAVPSAARPSALVDVGNALFHLRPWLARLARLLRDTPDEEELAPGFGGGDPADDLGLVFGGQAPADEGNEGD